jgi:hypothetical protein
MKLIGWLGAKGPDPYRNPGVQSVRLEFTLRKDRSNSDFLEFPDSRRMFPRA